MNIESQLEAQLSGVGGTEWKVAPLMEVPPENIELQPGQTVVIRLMKYLEYRITNQGWTVNVSCNEPIGVRTTNDEKSLTLLSFGDSAERYADDLGGVER